MAIAFVSGSGVGFSTLTPNITSTASVTVSGTNPMLILTISLGSIEFPSAQAGGVTSVTYNGVGMTQAVAAGGLKIGYSMSAQVFYMLNPPSGTHTISVTTAGQAGTIYNVYCAGVYSGVDQSSPVDTTATTSNIQTTANPSLAITTTTAGDMIIGVIVAFGSSPVTTTNQMTSSASFAAGYLPTTAPGNYTFNWTGSTTEWIMALVSFSPPSPSMGFNYGSIVGI